MVTNGKYNKISEKNEFLIFILDFLFAKEKNNQQKCKKIFRF